MIIQYVFRCILAFCPIGWCLDRPILHFGYITLSLSIRFAPASNSDVVKRFSAAMFRYFIITLVVVCVGVSGVITRKLFLRSMQSMLAKATAIGWKRFQIPCAGASVST